MYVFFSSLKELHQCQDELKELSFEACLQEMKTNCKSEIHLLKQKLHKKPNETMLGNKKLNSELSELSDELEKKNERIQDLETKLSNMLSEHVEINQARRKSVVEKLESDETHLDLKTLNEIRNMGKQIEYFKFLSKFCFQI